MDDPCLANADLDKPRHASSTPLRPIASPRVAQALALFGPILSQNYGLTEVPGTVLTLTPEDHVDQRASRLSAAGKPYPCVTVRLLNDQGLPVHEWGGGRDMRARAPCHARLLGPARRDGAALAGRLAAHRRHGAAGCGGLLPHRRPQEGHDRLGWLQHLPAAGRAGPVVVPSHPSPPPRSSASRTRNGANRCMPSWSCAPDTRPRCGGADRLRAGSETARRWPPKA